MILFFFIISIMNTKSSLQKEENLNSKEKKIATIAKIIDIIEEEEERARKKNVCNCTS